MDLEDIGEHCARPDCKLKDFLPFTCEECGKKYCLAHRTQESHSCAALPAEDDDDASLKKPIFCPVCNISVAYKPGDDVNQKISDHIDAGCPPNPGDQRRKAIKDSNRCTAKGCKKGELQPIICKMCNKKYCLRHRLEADHDCEEVRARAKAAAAEKDT